MTRPGASGWDAARAWCLRCGQPGAIVGHSLDAGRPLGVCQGDGRPDSGCGHVLLTTDRDEAERAFTRHRRKVTTSRHSRHDPARYPVPDCARCELAAVSPPLIPG